MTLAGSPNEKCSPPGPGVGPGGEPYRRGENCLPQGNVLVVQKGNTELPDYSQGVVIMFNFTPDAQLVYAIGLMNIDRQNTTIEVVHQAGWRPPTTTTIPVSVYGCNSVQTLEISIENVLQIRVNFAGSGAVMFISYCYPPGGGSKPPVSTTSFRARFRAKVRRPVDCRAQVQLQVLHPVHLLWLNHLDHRPMSA